MNGVCPECGAMIKGKKCAACGWSYMPEPTKSKGEYSHSPIRRCDWFTNGAQCHLPASLSISGWCAWHREWAKADKRNLDERSAFSEWRQVFLANYGHSPGPFGHEEGQVWLALTGVCNVPATQANTKREVAA